MVIVTNISFYLKISVVFKIEMSIFINLIIKYKSYKL